MTNEPRLTAAQIEANSRFARACDALAQAQDCYRLCETEEAYLTLLEAQQAARLAMWADPVDHIAPMVSHIDLPGTHEGAFGKLAEERSHN